MITSIYYNLGANEISYNVENTKKSLKDWMGFAFYVSNDVFANGLMG